MTLLARISRAMQHGEATPPERAQLQAAYNEAEGDKLSPSAEALLVDLERRT